MRIPAALADTHFGAVAAVKSANVARGRATRLVMTRTDDIRDLVTRVRYNIWRGLTAGPFYGDGCLEHPADDLAFLVEVYRFQLTGGADRGGLRCIVCRAAGEPVIGDLGDLAADAQRGVGAGDQEGAREAAADEADARHLFRAHRGDAAAWHGLRQLVDPLLEQILVGAHIRQLVGPRRIRRDR